MLPSFTTLTAIAYAASIVCVSGAVPPPTAPTSQEVNDFTQCIQGVKTSCKALFPYPEEKGSSDSIHPTRQSTGNALKVYSRER